MLAFEKEDDTFQGTKKVRLEQRVTPETKALIEQAADLSGVNLSEFTVIAATRAARQAVKDLTTTVLRPEQHAAFFAALEASDSPELTDLMKLHAEVTAGK